MGELAAAASHQIRAELAVLPSVIGRVQARSELDVVGPCGSTAIRLLGASLNLGASVVFLSLRPGVFLVPSQYILLF